MQQRWCVAWTHETVDWKSWWEDREDTHSWLCVWCCQEEVQSQFCSRTDVWRITEHPTRAAVTATFISAHKIYLSHYQSPQPLFIIIICLRPLFLVLSRTPGQRTCCHHDYIYYISPPPSPKFISSYHTTFISFVSIHSLGGSKIK